MHLVKMYAHVCGYHRTMTAVLLDTTLHFHYDRIFHFLLTLYIYFESQLPTSPPFPPPLPSLYPFLLFLFIKRQASHGCQHSTTYQAEVKLSFSFCIKAGKSNLVWETSSQKPANFFPQVFFLTWWLLALSQVAWTEFVTQVRLEFVTLLLQLPKLLGWQAEI